MFGHYEKWLQSTAHFLYVSKLQIDASVLEAQQCDVCYGAHSSAETHSYCWCCEYILFIILLLFYILNCYFQWSTFTWWSAALELPLHRTRLVLLNSFQVDDSLTALLDEIKWTNLPLIKAEESNFCLLSPIDAMKNSKMSHFAKTAVQGAAAVTQCCLLNLSSSCTALGEVVWHSITEIQIGDKQPRWIGIIQIYLTAFDWNNWDLIRWWNRWNSSAWRRSDSSF